MIICSPVASLFAEPDFSSEYVDESLYGEEVEIIDEYGKFVKIKTDYDYIGWTEKTNLSEKIQTPNFIVTAPFSDLLTENRYYHKPSITLPFGARIKVRLLGGDKRYALVEHSSGNYYIHKKQISPIMPNPCRTAITETAKKYLGVQYRWGGRTHAGIDCSGLCFNAYRFCGINIWRDADITKSANLRRIELSEAQAGDLIFFKGHVAMYLGNGRIIHSSAGNGCVAIEALNENEHLKEIYICAGTVFK